MSIQQDGDISKLIDICANNKGCEFSVAQILHHLGKDHFKYAGDNVWMRLDEKKDFVQDIHHREISHFCSIDVVHAFLQRALYYQESNPNNVHLKRILEISIKLRNSKFVNEVLQEAKSFFGKEG
jgi:vacuolar-type H+-ATPase catalytic subunit A/Vma1